MIESQTNLRNGVRSIRGSISFGTGEGGASVVASFSIVSRLTGGTGEAGTSGAPIWLSSSAGFSSTTSSSGFACKGICSMWKRCHNKRH